MRPPAQRRRGAPAERRESKSWASVLLPEESYVARDGELSRSRLSFIGPLQSDLMSSGGAYVGEEAAASMLAIQWRRQAQVRREAEAALQRARKLIRMCRTQDASIQTDPEKRYEKLPSPVRLPAPSPSLIPAPSPSPTGSPSLSRMPCSTPSPSPMASASPPLSARQPAAQGSRRSSPRHPGVSPPVASRWFVPPPGCSSLAHTPSPRLSSTQRADPSRTGPATTVML